MPERRYRLEAILALRVALRSGSEEQRESAGAVLQELAASADEVVSAMAQQAHDEPYPDSDPAALARDGEGRL